jgi:general secretion pathway protein G
MSMKNKTMMRRAVQKGFSLIEILIVLVLVVGIGAFAANRIFGQKDQANFRLAKAQLQTLSGKLDNYQLDVGGYPESLEQLVSNTNNSANWLGPYVRAEELKDPWGNAVVYQKPGTAGAYSLTSLGADGVAGGEGTKQDIVVNP